MMWCWVAPAMLAISKSSRKLTGSQHVLVTADVEHFERIPKLRLLRLPRG
jgi:hypothetical protein